MEPSPLTRQPQPDVFQPKVVQLYESLFKLQDDDAEKSEGFWTEFFLLRPDRPALRRVLDELGPADVVHLEGHTRDLFARAVVAVKAGRNGSDAHALETLAVFFSCVLSKKYAQPSSDIISVLAGINNVDSALTEFVGIMGGIIRSGKTLELRHKAVEVLLAFTAGAFQTTLLTYLIQRDLFPSVMKLIHESDSPDLIFKPFALLSLLANYNKFEFQNPYQLRLNDFVNEATIQKIVRSVGLACRRLRGQYIDIQDDLPEGWTLSNTLSIFGLGAIAPGKKSEKKKVVYDPETTKKMFTNLPGAEAAVLLATYDFTHANKLFCLNLVTLPADGADSEQPFASYLSLTSYLLQHAYLSPRTTHYSHLSLMVFRLLIEDGAICKRLCSDESKTAVRLCRQRQPHLPVVKGERTLAAALLDTMIDGINHNLRRRLDVGLYTLCVGITLRIISYMSRTRTRLAYHWAELFRSLLSLVRFLGTYTADVKDLPHIDTLLDHVVNVLALALSAGESFLPTPAAYDDLFYKVVEAGEVLGKFKDAFGLANRKSNSIDTLISVSAHYKQMLADGGAGSSPSKRRRGGQLTSLQVAEVIKEGYETLSIQAKEGLDTWDKFREADERVLLKKMGREAVGDVNRLVEGS
ncbi:uncharacterized protein DNG_07802 [Cephalotrichum gorgonifer]|uniref:Armadillo-like helical domain-containing protein n=1 Tax=Cephalotrichum gorgonifer TaxID=2041049 RepID=A0AAE8SYK6_9PEZI|nr:uncharacterized protein DNG_07802 [Cephalotrichum gorgonifer]